MFSFEKNHLVDTGHGPRTADIGNRHVGDLGNLTTDANGMVNVDIETVELIPR